MLQMFKKILVVGLLSLLCVLVAAPVQQAIAHGTHRHAPVQRDHEVPNGAALTQPMINQDVAAFTATGTELRFETGEANGSADGCATGTGCCATKCCASATDTGAAPATSPHCVWHVVRLRDFDRPADAPEQARLRPPCH